MATVRYLGVSPMCGDSPTLGDPEFYSEISKEIEAAMWWRAKEYKLTGTTSSGSFESYYVSNALSEKDLVCPENRTFNKTYDNWTPPSPDVYSSAILVPAGGAWGDTFYINGDKRYLRLNIYAEDGPTVLIGAYSFYGSNNGTSTLKILGQEVLFPVWYNTGSSNAIVEVTKYWPYDPDDGGGPIYDTATGAQIRPFPSA